MAIYKPYYTREFSEGASKFRHISKAIEKKVLLPLKDPYKNCKSELLVGNLRGFRSARLTKSVRVIFVICEECQNHGWKNYIQCSPQLYAKLSRQSVIFLCIDVHNKVYKRVKRTR